MKYEEALAKLAGRTDISYLTQDEINALSGTFTPIDNICRCSTCMIYYGSDPPADAVGRSQTTDYDRIKGKWICLK